MAVEAVQLVLQFIDDVDSDKESVNGQRDIFVEKINRRIDARIEELQSMLHSRQEELKSVHSKMEATMRQEDEFLFFGKRDATLDLFPTERYDFSSDNIKRIETPIMSEMRRLEKEINDLDSGREEIIHRELEMVNSQKALFDF